jgi:DNA-binding transcriptional MerR regulator/methylmalonyl-CoA mutase cobalamin-binding subunit
MKTKNLYSIKYAALQTGLTQHVIRAWERRYGAVEPRRTPKNRRVYSDKDIERLKKLKLLTANGHKISHVASLSSDELQRLIRKMVPADPQAQRKRLTANDAARAEYFYQACLSAVLALDQRELEQTYDHAMISLTRSALLADVIVPLLHEIGLLWGAGKLKIVNEHMAATVTRTVMLSMLRDSMISGSAPRIVVTTTAGETHELGALVVALKAAESGWHPHYFGPNLPAEEIAYGVKRVGARAVALSITHTPDLRRHLSELRKLRRYLKQDIAILVGGSAVHGSTEALKDHDVIWVENINHFSKALDKLL